MPVIDKQQMLTSLKLILGIAEDTFDDKLRFVIESICEEVRNFCNYADNQLLPKRLEITIISMAKEYLKYDSMGIASVEQSNIKSIQRGDTKIDYELGSMIQTAKNYGYLGSQIALLTRFKRITMRG